ncbi:MAG TPA: DNA-3-methyladenine glycosylase [Acidobacteriota bacterium]|nr:DNA-3-methyladenine glycosylase [Acidobacteriota bacterium]HNG95899.1 DNA-3-methyladenine glycosylase [Acidobacteriota bacterium]
MHTEAITHLSDSDPRLAKVIERVGECLYRPTPTIKPFDSLVSAIIYQQLSGKAAGTIHQRFLDLYGGTTPEPKRVLETPDEDLRKAGISRQKLGYLKDLAAKFEGGIVPVDDLKELDDEAMVEALTTIKGIGRWTVQMFLIRLGRLNVLPDADLGIQKAIKEAYELDSLPAPKEVVKIGAKWQPYCTIASWYLWRSIDG